jgi:hypothetical protein
MLRMKCAVGWRSYWQRDCYRPKSPCATKSPANSRQRPLSVGTMVAPSRAAYLGRLRSYKARMPVLQDHDRRMVMIARLRQGEDRARAVDACKVRRQAGTMIVHRWAARALGQAWLLAWAWAPA